VQWQIIVKGRPYMWVTLHAHPKAGAGLEVADGRLRGGSEVAVNGARAEALGRQQVLQAGDASACARRNGCK
jgi:hypothetical protein